MTMMSMELIGSDDFADYFLVMTAIGEGPYMASSIVRKPRLRTLSPAPASLDTTSSFDNSKTILSTQLPPKADSTINQPPPQFGLSESHGPALPLAFPCSAFAPCIRQPKPELIKLNSITTIPKQGSDLWPPDPSNIVPNSIFPKATPEIHLTSGFLNAFEFQIGGYRRKRQMSFVKDRGKEKTYRKQDRKQDRRNEGKRRKNIICERRQATTKNGNEREEAWSRRIAQERRQPSLIGVATTDDGGEARECIGVKIAWVGNGGERFSRLNLGKKNQPPNDLLGFQTTESLVYSQTASWALPCS